MSTCSPAVLSNQFLQTCRLLLPLNIPAYSPIGSPPISCLSSFLFCGTGSWPLLSIPYPQTPLPRQCKAGIGNWCAGGGWKSGYFPRLVCDRQLPRQCCVLDGPSSQWADSVAPSLPGSPAASLLPGTTSSLYLATPRCWGGSLQVLISELLHVLLFALSTLLVPLQLLLSIKFLLLIYMEWVPYLWLDPDWQSWLTLFGSKD